MTKRKLKPFVVPMLYTIAITFFVFSMYYLQKAVSTSAFKSNDIEKVETKYVDDEIVENHNYLPVINITTTMIKPFLSENVTVKNNYYDYEATEEEQRQSIIYYEDTYMQNSGIDYTSEESFEVISVLDGKVLSIEEDSILGNIIKIEHDQGIISVYKSVTEICVQKDDTIVQGQQIAKSGTSNLNTDSPNNLHFELYVNNSLVDPENSFGKTIDEIAGE